MSTPAAIDLGALFDGASRSVVRVESLPTYDVGGDEGERLAAWREGRPRPERSVRTNGYLRRVAAAVARGVTWERLRVIDDPPTEYQSYQLQAYVESQAVGEQVSIAQRADLGFDPREDVWLVDDTAVLLEYDLDGHFVGNRPLTGDDRERAIYLADRVKAAVVPLNVYLAGDVPAARRAS